MTNRNYALIVAAGRGSRAKRDDNSVAKQYIHLNGQPILQHVLAKFSDNKMIDAILVVIHPDDEEIYNKISKGISDKLLPVVYGGETRQISVFNGLQALETLNPETVLIHDGARPCFTQDLITRIVTALSNNDAILPALPINDTLKQTKNNSVIKTIDRTGIWAAQTPQSFHFDKIYAAHKAAQKEGNTQEFTDDCSIAEWFGIRVKIILGEEENIKITTVSDFARGEKFLNKDIDIRVGHGFDVHAFEEGNEIILCGVSIPFNKKLKGHSDADVGLHALTDAIYGALGEGDIGTHFPPSDPQWKGASSDRFLSHAAELLSKRGAKLSNVDVTLICEAPKIGPHSNKMKSAIAAIINLDPQRISIKATTTEQLGFNGRGEGISALATATIIF